jgi:hypothetical protein
MADNQTGARLVYRNAVKSMLRAGVDPRSAVLSQSYLRFEQLVSSTKTNYQFGVLQNDTGNSNVAVRPTEQRLALQDSFYVSSIQVLLGNAASATDTSFPLHTYNNQNTFNLANYANFYNLYNSSLRLTVNNKNIATAWDIFRHYVIPQTQQITAAITATSALSQIDGGVGASYECEPNWVLIGSKNNQLTINLPNAISPAAATFPYIVIIMRGVLAQNVTVVS